MVVKRILLFVLSAALLLTAASCGEADGVGLDSAGGQAVSESVVGGGYEPGVAMTVSPVASSDSGITLPQTIDERYIKAVKDKLDSAPYACALYYTDLETGLSITYNPDRMFAGASLVKAEYLMMIFEQIQSGDVSYDDLFVYTSANKRGGTTKIPYEHEYGDRLSLKEIIEYVVLHSDNTGFNMLQVNVRSLWDLQAWAKQRYGTTFTYDKCNWLNARGVAECWKEIYKRYADGDEDYMWYVSLLLEANENKFVKGGLPKDANGECLYDVAHKYGMDINASNDAAIVFYKDRPYFLCILTDYIGINTQSFMNAVSSEVFALHEYICSFNG